MILTNSTLPALGIVGADVANGGTSHRGYNDPAERPAFNALNNDRNKSVTAAIAREQRRPDAHERGTAG